MQFMQTTGSQQQHYNITPPPSTKAALSLGHIRVHSPTIIAIL